MPGIFDSGGRQVITVDPTTVYRCTNEYIKAQWPSEIRTYFMTHQPAEWRENSTMRQKFCEVYDKDQIYPLDMWGVVPENMDAVWVGGSAKVRPVYHGAPKDIQQVSDRIDELEARIKALEES